MKFTVLPTAAFLTVLGFSTGVGAENLEHLSQLLSTQQCPGCDLSGSGLVMSNLSGAQLSGANLSHANLSQANLTGADLTGADLTGASLHGANLTGANLSGAILNGTDLRGAYLNQANFTGTNLDAAYVQGATGIPNSAGTPDLFYGWGMLESNKGNYTAALEHYNKAIALDPEFAPAYLGRGLVLYRLGNEPGAIENGEMASQLFEEQENDPGHEASENFLKTIEGIRNSRSELQMRREMDKLVRGVGSLLLQFLLR